MVTVNTALIARAGAVAIIGKRAAERCTAPLENEADAEAVMNEVALALWEEAARREQTGWRWLCNRIAALQRMNQPCPDSE